MAAFGFEDFGSGYEEEEAVGGIAEGDEEISPAADQFEGPSQTGLGHGGACGPRCTGSGGLFRQEGEGFT